MPNNLTTRRASLAGGRPPNFQIIRNISSNYLKIRVEAPLSENSPTEPEFSDNGRRKEKPPELSDDLTFWS